MSRKVTVPLRLSFELLREQKSLLLELQANEADVAKANLLDGLVNMLDAIQDYAVDDLRVPAKEVFGRDYQETP